MMRPPPTGMQSSGQLDNNDAIALVANFFIPGVGYFMLGQSQKGIATLLLTFFTCGLSYLAVVIVVYDAYMVALARKKRPVGEWEFFPK
jgi:TM2 domain-containing membrane protein YozV